MSFPALTWVASVRAPTPMAKLVAFVMADMADAEGRMFCKSETLCDRAGLDPRTVAKALAALKTAGLIVIDRRSGTGGATFHYTLQVPGRTPKDVGSSPQGRTLKDEESSPGKNPHLCNEEPSSLGVQRTHIFASPNESDISLNQKEQSGERASARGTPVDFLTSAEKDQAKAKLRAGMPLDPRQQRWALGEGLVDRDGNLHEGLVEPPPPETGHMRRVREDVEGLTGGLASTRPELPRIGHAPKDRFGGNVI